MKIRMFVAGLAALLLAACNPGAQIEDAKTQITKFHGLYNDSNGDALYRFTGEEFRKVTTRKQLDDMVAVVATRLGKVESSKQTGFNTAFNNGTTITTIVMQTNFQKGVGQETFVFAGSGETMQLVGWNVNAPQLSLTAEEARKLSEAAAGDK